VAPRPTVGRKSSSRGKKKETSSSSPRGGKDGKKQEEKVTSVAERGSQFKKKCNGGASEPLGGKGLGCSPKRGTVPLRIKKKTKDKEEQGGKEERIIYFAGEGERESKEELS